MRKFKFENTSIYHLYNRGVEKRTIFLNDEDYYRFIHNLYEFNNEAPAENVYYRKLYEVGPHKINKAQLVKIHAFCLMPNHFHLLLRQTKDNGIQTFMKKIGTGYAMYFNQKYQRVGGLFQGRFKAVRVERNEHLSYLHYYIHLNPLGLIASEWKKNEIKDINKVIEFLESYRWSSYLDYIGKKNFPSVINKEFLLELIESPEKYKKNIIEWLKEKNLTDITSSVLLD